MFLFANIRQRCLKPSGFQSGDHGTRRLQIIFDQQYLRTRFHFRELATRRFLSSKDKHLEKKAEQTAAEHDRNHAPFPFHHADECDCAQTQREPVETSVAWP